MSDTAETKNKPAEAAASPAEAPSTSGGFKAWLPLIVTVVLMPVLAYLTTTFLLVPKLQVAARGSTAPAHSEEEENEAAAEDHGAKGETTEGHGGKSKGHKGESGGKTEKTEGNSGKGEKTEKGEKGEKSEGHDAKAGKGGKATAQFGKVLVNVAGSLGSRYLLVNFTLVGASNLKDKVEDNKDQMLDSAMSVLSTKSINELEKPGSRNLIRSELISAFNGILGGGAVREIYFTEFAIQ